MVYNVSQAIGATTPSNAARRKFDVFQNLKSYTVTELNGREHETKLQCSSCMQQMRRNTKISTTVGIFYMAPCKNTRQQQQETYITGYVTNLML
jgi:cbb3-type cytochrome oxidase cytochrome c subunit